MNTVRLPESVLEELRDIGARIRPPFETEIVGLLVAAGNPPIVLAKDFMLDAPQPLREWWRRNQPLHAHRMARAGYVRIVNPETKNGRWVINARMVIVYGRKNLTAEKRRHLALLLTVRGRRAEKRKAGKENHNRLRKNR